jgi:hypothetical protein
VDNATAQSLLRLDKTRAARILGVTVPTMNRAIRAAVLRGIASPFAPLDGITGRAYTTIAALKKWVSATQELSQNNNREAA